MNKKAYCYETYAPKPQTIIPAVSAVIVNHKQEFSLQVRVDNEKWSLPGGIMEPGGTVKEEIKPRLRRN